jgi:predicted dithiol-disulfide oxidoreductase (DUF899 family)
VTVLDPPAVVSYEEWLAARRQLLVEEKELTRARDRVDEQRRRLPMVRIDKPYTFEGPTGPVGLLDLFDGREQLIVHHFMWTFEVDADGVEHPGDTSCPNCAASADRIGELSQLHVRNTTLVAVSRGPYAKIARFRARMGYDFPWYSSAGSDFNWDFHTTLDERVTPVLLDFRTEADLAGAGKPWTSALRGEWPAISAFLRMDDTVYLTYSTFGRGIEFNMAGNDYLALTAMGRQEAWEHPRGRATPLGMHAGGPAVRFRDEYDDRGVAPTSADGTRSSGGHGGGDTGPVDARRIRP